jgi:hypothetical protein
MLGICEPRDVEERLVVDVGIAVGRVSNRSPALDTVDRVSNIGAGDEGAVG